MVAPQESNESSESGESEASEASDTSVPRNAEVTLALASHPLLDAAAFVTEFPGPLESVSADALLPLLRLSGASVEPPFAPDETVQRAVRDVLRYGGYKPTGRGKPASEYLVRAASEGQLGPINAAVDACNVVSLHSGLPVSVVDLGRASPPLRIAVAEPGARYVFNASGQEIDLEGLVCLFDASGPCANAVKDSQRTKTHAATTRTLSIVWGAKKLEGRTARAVDWYRDLLKTLSADTREVRITSEASS